MAKRKTNTKAQSKGSQAVVIFWLAFVIIIISIFMINAPVIQKNFDLFKTRLTAAPGAEEEILEIEEEPPVTVTVEQRPPEPPQVTEPVRTTPQAERPAETTRPQTQPQVQTPAPVQTRERAIYFTNVGNDGQILHSRVTRRVPVSDSPMQDALNVLLAGPSADEVGRGILNLIPQNTRVLSAAIRGSTAYINFSEDFLYNTFGVEGYVAQLRQIVWTVTEFQNVRDVQFLIEGRRFDYLGEGIWIGSPISRQSF
ncbi:MAG: GerMN domain-containing protein [Treponema sp.]|nr:GerMN domain-containing protein [Treponema sp.]